MKPFTRREKERRGKVKTAIDSLQGVSTVTVVTHYDYENHYMMARTREQVSIQHELPNVDIHRVFLLKSCTICTLQPPAAVSRLSIVQKQFVKMITQVVLHFFFFLQHRLGKSHLQQARK